MTELLAVIGIVLLIACLWLGAILARNSEISTPQPTVVIRAENDLEAPAVSQPAPGVAPTSGSRLVPTEPPAAVPPHTHFAAGDVSPEPLMELAAPPPAICDPDAAVQKMPFWEILAWMLVVAFPLVILVILGLVSYRLIALTRAQARALQSGVRFPVVPSVEGVAEVEERVETVRIAEYLGIADESQ